MRVGPFGPTLSLGHHGLHLWPELRENANDLVRLSGIAQSLDDLTGGEAYCDRLLANLGSAPLDIMDNSSYEGANITHDMNDPVPESMHGRYKTIIDSGTIEHVYNTPGYITNVINMLRLNGVYLMITTANNYLGHGFYQYSPEWAYRTFSCEQGFEVLSCYIVNCDRKYDLVPAIDPKLLGKRVELFMTVVPAYLMVAARKTAIVKPFQKWPQQSDYVMQWSDSNV